MQRERQNATTVQRQVRTDNKLDVTVAPSFGVFNGLVGICDCLLHIEPMQVDFVGLAILFKLSETIMPRFARADLVILCGRSRSMEWVK